MRRLALTAMLLTLPSAAAPAEEPSRIYLVSIADVALRPGERAVGFKILSWGVKYGAVCRIPYGWRIKAGGNATSEGWLEGEGTHGATWISDLSRLRDFALVRVWGPLQWTDKPIKDGVLPATFAGTLELSSGRKVRLGPRSIRLVPARACPPPRW